MKKFPHPKPFNFAQSHRLMLIEEKLDGYRLQLCKGEAFGRSKSAEGYWINKWKMLPDCIKEIAPSIPIDGEIWWPGHEATDVITAMKENSTELVFTGFRVCDKDLYPHEHLIEIASMGLKVPNVLFDEYKISIDTSYIKFLLSLAKIKNLEGWMLKERYRTVHLWWKLKVTETYDVIITGLNIGTAGKYKEKLASLRCSAYINNVLTEVANVSGMSDKIRYSISEKDIGRVIEVEANLLASKGRLKHPRFKRFRDDKIAKACTF